MATLKTLRTTTAVALAVTLLTAGCGGDDPAPTSPATSSTTSTTPSSTTSSSTTPATPTGAEAASAAVIAFYKELDAVAQGKARLDSFRHATTPDGVKGTLPKWQGILGSQRGRGILQVGDTSVTISDVTKGKKAKAGSTLWPSWIVTACIDHSQSHLEQKGKTVDWPGQMREQVTHVVVDTGDGDFRVVEDDPGKSC
ncbi:hypothetical protein [Nostocoides sp.]|uniref:hypothetical protein n=1 Tax=Nostocoides sp. TaxID=1917966 RepID=UPI003BAE68CF